jgi:hypothetical protein
MIEADDLSSVEELFLRSRDDFRFFCLNGLGIDIHEAQDEVAEAVREAEALYYLLTWANRAGKTTIVGLIHMWLLFTKHGIPPVRDWGDEKGYQEWLKIQYRTLHTAPLNELAGRAYDAWTEILQGVSPAQWDKETGAFRPAPLAPFFALTKERDNTGADRMFLRCLTGGVTDFRSTEGKARRLESGTWRFISWDEWPQTEGIDPAEEIRTVLIRLTNRAADFDASILLTGTITDETEHIAKEFLNLADDPENPDWWGNTAARSLNPNASTKAMERAERNMEPEDYSRTVLGIPGGAKGRLFPPYMIAPLFVKDMPRFQPPHPLDGVSFEIGPPAIVRGMDYRVSADGTRLEDTALTRVEHVRARFVPKGATPYTYLHLWDLAIAAAENVGIVWRLPADWNFGWIIKEGQRTLAPIEGVKLVIVPGSRTLTDDEILHAIEETYLPYGGLIVVDNTDAHGKNIHRKLRRAGYPVEGFGFNERDRRGVIRKDAAIGHMRDLLTEGMAFERAPGTNEIVYDPDGVPRYNRDVPYGVIRMPVAWTKVSDQLSTLKVDNTRQTKDAAMAALMGGSVAYRTRRARTRRAPSSRFAVFAGGHRYGERHDGRRPQRS